MNKVYIGIDPGKTGFITLFKNGEYKFFAMPEHKVETGKFGKTGKPLTKMEFHEAGMKQLLIQLREETRGFKILAAIEKVGGREGWSAQNNFNFGHTTGMLINILHILGAEIIEPRPQKWQSFMRQGYPDIKKPSSTGKTMVSDAKAVAQMIVEKEFPHIDFRKTEKARVNDHNKIDSFLMCVYLIRTDSQKIE